MIGRNEHWLTSRRQSSRCNDKRAVVIGGGFAIVIANHHGTTPPVSIASLSPSVAAHPTNPFPIVTGHLPTIPASPTGTPAASAPHITLAPTGAPIATLPAVLGPPSISGTSVVPPLIYEHWSAGPVPCRSTYANDETTYAYISATINASYGVHSATVYFSFPGNSGSGALELVYGSTTQWYTYVGGYDYTAFDIPATETISYYITVIDNHGNHVTSPTVTNQVQPCAPPPSPSPTPTKTFG